MVFELKFHEFNYGKLDFDWKSLLKGLDLVTSRLYTKRDPDELVCFWVRRWLLHIYFDSMKLHHKILQWLSIFLFYLDSQLFLHPILQIHQLSIWYVYVCIKLTTYYCMNSIRNDFIMQPHTFFFFFIANVQIVKKVQNWNVVCTF